MTTAPTGHASASTWRLTSDTARSITGFSGGYDGRLLIVGNDNSTSTITLIDASTSRQASNRFSFGYDVVLSAKQRAILQYDSTDSRWKLVSYDRPPLQHGQCVLAKSGANLLLSPRNGNRLLIGGVQQAIPSAGVSLAPTSLSSGTTYFIYAFMSGATMTLEASTTTHATDSVLGVEIKSGDSSRTLVGVARIVSGPAWQDTATQRFVRSWFNRGTLLLANAFSTARTSTANPAAEINTEIRCEFVCFSDDPALAKTNAYTYNSGSNYTFIAASFDGVAPTSFGTSFGTSPGSDTSAFAETTLADGYHYATVFGSVSGGTGNYGNSTAGVVGYLKAQIG